MAHELLLAIAYFIPNVEWKGWQEEIDIKGTIKSPGGNLVAKFGVQNGSSQWGISDTSRHAENNVVEVERRKDMEGG